MKAALAVVTVAVLLYPRAATAANYTDMPVDAAAIAPAGRLLDFEPPVEEVVAPEGSRCPELYAVAVEHWPGAALHWPMLDLIFWRESRCNPSAINRRSGTRGLMQITRGNLRRLGVSYADALDPAVNIATGYRLCLQSMEYGRSCWRPWHAKGFRP
jgi:soluble lytic murein transglycosylase-like protein